MEGQNRMQYCSIIMLHASQNINNKNTMKKDNVKGQRTKNQPVHGLPIIDNSSFNQTIIINNPKININYIEQMGHMGAKGPNTTNTADFQFKRENASKGFQQNYNNDANIPKDISKPFDAWSFNKNLKEFSETRQLGFFKNHPNSKSKHQKLQQSPYLGHKTKTQDLRPANKITPHSYLHKVSEPVSFRQHNRTLSTIKKQTLQPLEKSREKERQRQKDRSQPHSKAYLNNNQKFRSKKFDPANQKNQKTPKQILSERTIVPLHPDIKKRMNETNNKNLYQFHTIAHNTHRQQNKMPQKMIKIETRDQYDEDYEEYDDFLQNAKNNGMNNVNFGRQIDNEEEYDNIRRQFNTQNQNQPNYDALESSLINQSPLLRSPYKKPKSQGERNISNTEVLSNKRTHNNRTYQKSIDKISQCFLGKVDNYFDHYDTLDIPSSKIQLYATTMHQPMMFSQSNTQDNLSKTKDKGSEIEQIYQGYDFQFQQEKGNRKRPKTPYKRKKMYEQIY